MYKIINNSSVMRTTDMANIPTDPDNTDYADYLIWLSEGNTPEPAEPTPIPDYEAQRRVLYQAEADPLFFKWHRGEATQAEWLAKVAEIKARY